MPRAEKATTEVVSYKELKEKHDKKTAMDMAKAKIEEDYSNNGGVFQIDGLGIVRAVMKQDKSTGEVNWNYPNLTNFTIKDLSLIENLDTQENSIKFTATNIRRVERVIEDSVKIFNEAKDFREALNSMHFSFKGNVNDLQDIRDCIVSTVLSDEKFVYRTAGFREINDELVYITSDGALKKGGTFDETLKVDKDTFKSSIQNLELITADEVRFIKNALNNFNTPDVVYPVLGSSVACNFVNFFNNSKDGKLHVLFIAGGSDSGKSYTVDNIIKPLLNVDYETESCSNATTANFNRSTNESCTLPIIYDEHTLRNLKKDRIDMLYTWIRTTTERTTVKRVARGSDDRIDYKTQAPMIILGENIPTDVSILNRSNLVFMSESKRKSKDEYKINFEFLTDNDLLLRKLGYTVKRYILEQYNQEKVDKNRKMIAESLKGFDLGSREFKTLRDCVFGIQALNDSVKHYTGESVFDDLNQVAQVIYDNIVENVAGGGTEAQADFIDVLDRIDRMIAKNDLREGWHYLYDVENDIIKLDFKMIFDKMDELNIKCDMPYKEFTKKITHSGFIVGNKKEDYYKQQRLYTSYNKKDVRRVFLIKMSKCKELNFTGLSNQIETEPTNQTESTLK